MPGTWPTNTCGYCGNVSGSPVDKYICPRCKRTGCPTCMPTGDSEICPYCVEQEEQEREFNLGRPV